MKTVTHHIRNHLLSDIIIDTDDLGRHANESMNSIIGRKRASDYDQRCNQRLVVGTFRYDNGYKYDAIGSAIKRLQKYQAGDHNKEYLVDAGNLCRIEYDNPLYDDVYFDAADDGEHSEKIS